MASRAVPFLLVLPTRAPPLNILLICCGNHNHSHSSRRHSLWHSLWRLLDLVGRLLNLVAGVGARRQQLSRWLTPISATAHEENTFMSQKFWTHGRRWRSNSPFRPPAWSENLQKWTPAGYKNHKMAPTGPAIYTQQKAIYTWAI